jgi:hypothetical protein
MVNTDTYEGNIHNWVNTRHGLEGDNDRDEQSTEGNEVRIKGEEEEGWNAKNLKVMRAS